MRVLTFASLKGGTGKTTLAAHVAVKAAMDGERVVVIDLDAQANLAEWFNDREAETPDYARCELDQLDDAVKTLTQGNYTLAVIDTPASDVAALRAALVVSDAVLMPVQPSPNDLRAAPATMQEIEKSGKRFALVLSRRVARTRISEDAIIALGNIGTVCPVVIGSRTVYAAAMIDGRTAQEIEPNGPAADEVASLWKFAKGMLK